LSANVRRPEVSRRVHSSPEALFKLTRMKHVDHILSKAIAAEHHLSSGLLIDEPFQGIKDGALPPGHIDVVRAEQKVH
jgi:hypothetical protein